MYLPDIRVGPPLERRSEKTGKPLKPIQYVFAACVACGELSCRPLKANGTLGKQGLTRTLTGCPFCTRRY